MVHHGGDGRWCIMEVMMDGLIKNYMEYMQDLKYSWQFFF